MAANSGGMAGRDVFPRYNTRQLATKLQTTLFAGVVSMSFYRKPKAKGVRLRHFNRFAIYMFLVFFFLVGPVGFGAGLHAYKPSEPFDGGCESRTSSSVSSVGK